MSMPLPRLNADGASALDAHLQKTVEQRHVPACFFLATNAKETIYSNQAGEVQFGDASSGQVDEDSTLELFSQTKFITAIAALQCVDQGLVKLDSTEDVEKYLPEIKALQVLTGYKDNGEPVLEEQKKKVTLRQLLSHSAGTPRHA
jgi:CubicO group peptidase (beta-lactamase class C family)